MGEERGVIKGRFFRDGLRVLAYILILYGIIGLILVRVGLWNSPPVYILFCFCVWFISLSESKTQRIEKELIKRERGVINK